jgi:Fe-S oxidoreductase
LSHIWMSLTVYGVNTCIGWCPSCYHATWKTYIFLVRVYSANKTYDCVYDRYVSSDDIHNIVP